MTSGWRQSNRFTHPFYPQNTHFTPKNTFFTHPFTPKTMNENFIFILAILFVGAILLSAYILDSAEGEG